MELSAVLSQIYINTEEVIISNNTATYGGGIFLKESTLFINEPVKIYYNTAQEGSMHILAELSSNLVIQVILLTTLLRIMVEVFMQYLQLL